MGLESSVSCPPVSWAWWNSSVAYVCVYLNREEQRVCNTTEFLKTVRIHRYKQGSFQAQVFYRNPYVGKVVFVLKPALLGAQCSISRERFYAQFSPLCPACAFLWELAGNTMGLSCSRHKGGHTKVIFYMLRVRGWSYEGSFCLCCITCVHLPASF